MKKYFGGAVFVLFIYLWLNRKHAKPLNVKVRRYGTVQKLANKFSKTPKPKTEVIVLPRNKNYIKNKMKGKIIANSMSIRSASKSFNKQTK